MFSLSGKVIKGDGYGRKLGFPTMNIQTTEETPPYGVYSGRVILDGKEYRAGILINPEINHKRKVEAHLIGYDGDAYGKMVALEINKFLREYEKFDTEAELIAQIKEDIKICSQA